MNGWITELLDDVPPTIGHGVHNKVYKHEIFMTYTIMTLVTSAITCNF